jgi:hypothetical protein
LNILLFEQMKQYSTRIFFLALTLGVTVVGCGKKTEGDTAKPGEGGQTASATGSSIERGKYLVETIGGCNDCHTPWKMGDKGPAPDMTKMLSGSPEGMRLPPPMLNPPWGWAGSLSMTAFAGPWGISYSANLTPDMETGLGKWTDADFIKTMRTGIGSHNRPIMAPMPWEAIGHASDDDLKAIFAYLHSVPAIKNKVPDYEAASASRGPAGPGMPPPGVPPPTPPPPMPKR